jgi:nucleotide-binding universal stress UspA family protein
VEDVVLLDPAGVLVRASFTAGLLVLGRRSEEGLGPVASAVVRHTRCPLAAVPA